MAKKNKKNKKNVQAPVPSSLTISTEMPNGLTPFLFLPMELQVWIFSFLKPSDLLRASQACKLMYKVGETDYLWKFFGAPNKGEFLKQAKINHQRLTPGNEIAKKVSDLLKEIKHTKEIKSPRFLILGDRKYTRQLFGDKLDFSVTPKQSTQGYSWHLVQSYDYTFLVFKPSKSMANNVEQIKSLPADKRIDVAIFAITDPREIDYYMNLLASRPDILILFAVPSTALVHFSQLPVNAIILSEEYEPLGSFYGRVVKKIQEFAKDKKHSTTSKNFGCTIS